MSNTYNRIIAAVTKQAIQPALLSYISTDQTGFTPGRSIEENIVRFNELFYAALDGEEEYSMLLFDIEKAFDSVSHKTLHALLEHVGLPEQHRNIVKGLFHKVTVTTNFQGANNLDINIERGTAALSIGVIDAEGEKVGSLRHKYAFLNDTCRTDGSRCRKNTINVACPRVLKCCAILLTIGDDGRKRNAFICVVGPCLRGLNKLDAWRGIGVDSECNAGLCTVSKWVLYASEYFCVCECEGDGALCGFAGAKRAR